MSDAETSALLAAANGAAGNVADGGAVRGRVGGESDGRRSYGSAGSGANTQPTALPPAHTDSSSDSARPLRLVVDELDNKGKRRARPPPAADSNGSADSAAAGPAARPAAPSSRSRNGGVMAVHRGMGVRQLLRYYVPLLRWLPQYDARRHLLPDALAGVTVAVMLVPQSIAYAAMAGLPPLVGLYTAFYPAIIYCVLGSSRQMHVGPESTTVILLSHALARYAAALAPRLGALGADDPTFVPLMLAQTFRLTFLSGIMALAMGLLRVGFVDSVLSQPILQGFVFSTALLLITDQFPKLLGLSSAGQLSPDARAVDKWQWSLSNLDKVHWPTAVVALSSIGLIVLIRLLKAKGPRARWLQNFPELLLVLLLATVVSSLAHLDARFGIAVLGAQPSGFTAPRWSSLGIFGSSAATTGAGEGEQSELLTTSLSVALIGYINSGIVSKLYAQRSAACPRHDVSSNRELVALGTANVFASFFGAFPAYGSMLRTKVADDVGATSQVSGLVCSLVVGVVILALLPLFALMPKAVISAMIVVIAAALLDLAPIRALVRVGDARDLALYVASIAVTFLFGVDVGIFFAFASCLMMLVKETNKPAVTLLGRADASGDFQALETPDDESAAAAAGQRGAGPGDDDAESDSTVGAHVRTPSGVSKVRSVLIVKLDGALHFANAGAMQQALQRLEKFSNSRAHPASSPRPFFDSHGQERDAEQGDAEAADVPFGDDSWPPAVSESASSSSSSAGSPRESVVLDLTDCPSMDSTAVLALASQLEQYNARGLLVLLVLRRAQLHDKLMAAGADRFVVGMFKHLQTAVSFAENQRSNAIAAAPL